MQTRDGKAWFITGASRGFGRQWATAALNRGDRVAATARDIEALDDLEGEFGDRLLRVRLDVTDRAAAFRTVRLAHEHFGALDVVVNNAGYGQFGFVEELTEAESRLQIATNFFGPLWVTQAALPFMRARGSGHIIQVSSIAGVTAHPNLGIYHASKWALEGLSESLAQEVAPLGINVTIVEPALFKTDWSGSSAKHAQPNAAYAEGHQAFDTLIREMETEAGEPHATAAVLLRLVDDDEPPMRVFFGSPALTMAKGAYHERLLNWEKYQQLAIDAQDGRATHVESA